MSKRCGGISPAASRRYRRMARHPRARCRPLLPFAGALGRDRSMRGSAAPASTLRAWGSIPRRIRRAITGLSSRELGWRGGSEDLSIREYAHHLVEANLVASTIALAALGKPGCRFDWSWMVPDARWRKGLGYDRAPVEPAIRLLEALAAHVTGLVRNAPGAMSRSVRLVGSPGARPRGRTVDRLLADECEHAARHLRDIADTKKTHRRSGELDRR